MTFWKTTPLHVMTPAQWESLCDGCGQCCQVQLENERGERARTNLACRYLDTKACRCTVYAERDRYVPDCVRLTPDNLAWLDWMPSTCAYRLLANGEDLPDWHPLVSGDPASVHRAGPSVRGRLVSEATVPASAWDEHIVSWVTP
jgi:uncharacterized cysteine cluster protein YcgN (CxxCxxCC family)